jgi:hypothetical protein
MDRNAVKQRLVDKYLAEHVAEKVDEARREERAKFADWLDNSYGPFEIPMGATIAIPAPLERPCCQQTLEETEARIQEVFEQWRADMVAAYRSGADPMVPPARRR